MSSDVANIENNKVKNVLTGESVEIKSFWENNNTVIIFFRRWGCTFCRLWGKELSEIAPILKKHDIRLIGIGVEEVGSKLFADRKYFDGELYYVEERSTYQKLGFKRFNHMTILTSLLWKQSREAMSKGLWEFGGDLKGDWVQVGGALLVKTGGNVVRHFIQQGPADHLPNLDILKAFGLEGEFKPETMENKSGDERVKSAGDLKTPTEGEPQPT